MPKFVKENSLDESELEEQIQQEKERLEKQLKEEKRERKTLKDQLRESKEKKYREYQESLGSQNSSYKLDAKSARFHARLKAEEQEKELKAKRDEEEQVSRFRSLRKSQSTPSEANGRSTQSPNLSVPTKIKKRKIADADMSNVGTEAKKKRELSPLPSEKTASEKTAGAQSSASEEGPIQSLHGYTSSEEEEEEEEEKVEGK